MSIVNVMDEDKIYCETIAKSISDIIRFSLNEEFRRSSCELFGVSCTKDAELEISKRLMIILENKNKPKNRCKNKNKGNLEEENSISKEKSTDESSTSTEGSSRMQNTVQPNWLQISSQQYRKTVKRKRLQFYSQPHEKDFECSSLCPGFSNSQPTEVPSSSKLTEMMDSVDGGTEFCKKKFRESFEENAGKYLKENLKYCKHMRF